MERETRETRRRERRTKKKIAPSPHTTPPPPPPFPQLTRPTGLFRTQRERWKTQVAGTKLMIII